MLCCLHRKRLHQNGDGASEHEQIKTKNKNRRSNTRGAAGKAQHSDGGGRRGRHRFFFTKRFKYCSTKHGNYRGHRFFFHSRVMVPQTLCLLAKMELRCKTKETKPTTKKKTHRANRPRFLRLFNRTSKHTLPF